MSRGEWDIIPKPTGREGWVPGDVIICWNENHTDKAQLRYYGGESGNKDRPIRGKLPSGNYDIFRYAMPAEEWLSKHMGEQDGE